MMLALLACLGCNPSGPNKPTAKTVPPTSEPASKTSFWRLRAHPTLSDCTFENGKSANLSSILEIVGGGVGCFDYDGDRLPDLIFPRGGTIDPNQHTVQGLHSQVLRNRGEWQWANATSPAHVDTSRIYGHGVCVADLDHDGFDDALVYGHGGTVLLQNQGDGTFRPHIDEGGSRGDPDSHDASPIDQLTQSRWITAAAWIDWNDDGNLDLFLGSYVNWNFENHRICPSRDGRPDVCSPNAFGESRNRVYLNRGDGRFVALEEALVSKQPAKTLGVLAARYDASQQVGLYVANDLIANSMYTWQEGEWVEHAYQAGVALDDDGVANGSMGVALLDFNMDLKFDLFVTNFEHERMALYAQSSPGLYQYQSRSAGLNRPSLELVGFGVVSGDFDGDRDEDVVFTSGHVHYHPDHGTMESLPAYLRNEKGRSFSHLAPEGPYFDQLSVGRGLAAADLDLDGDLDLVGTCLFEPPQLLENTHPQSTWLRVYPIGTRSHRTPVGTTVRVETDAGVMARQLYSGGSYLSDQPHVLHFSWPNDPKDRSVKVVVNWPDGTEESIDNVAPNTDLRIVQGRIGR